METRKSDQAKGQRLREIDPVFPSSFSMIKIRTTLERIKLVTGIIASLCLAVMAIHLLV